MKQLFLALFLLIVISLSFSFVYAKVSAYGAEDNYFNQNLRTTFSQYPMMRHIIGLHYDGDAKYDYLSRDAHTIIIEVDAMEGITVPRAVMERLAKKITYITDKEVSIKYSHTAIPFQEAVSFADLEDLKEKQYHLKAKTGEVGLYVLIASTSSDSPQRLGSTLQEDGLVFFQSNLKKFANAHNQDGYENIILGTLLHEFGHQIGLDHNDGEGCLMNAVNVYDTTLRAEDIIFDFCEQEIREIKNIKTNI